MRFFSLIFLGNEITQSSADCELCSSNQIIIFSFSQGDPAAAQGPRAGHCGAGRQGRHLDQRQRGEQRESFNIGQKCQFQNISVGALPHKVLICSEEQVIKKLSASAF